MTEPHTWPLVLDTTPKAAQVTRLERADLYAPAASSEPRPTVVFVHGPVGDHQHVRPRDWALYRDYGQLAASHGLVGAVVDLPHFRWPFEPVAPWTRALDDLGAALTTVRAAASVDADRVGLWGFSGGCLTLSRYLDPAPAWLRCATLAYPLVYAPTTPPDRPFDTITPRCPTVVLRAGRDKPDWLAATDDYLASPHAADVRRIDVAHGRHGFDARDDTDESRDAIAAAMSFLLDHLTGT